MFRSTEYGRRVVNLSEAFKKDGFEVAKIVNWSGRTGISAESRDATNYDTGQKKKIYYLEGTAYEMGYLLGLLAESEIARMATDFADRVVFAFIGVKVLERIKLLQEALIFVVYEIAKNAYAKLPQEIRDEVQGLYDGCRSFNPKTSVKMDHLIALNLGIDTICSMVYPGNFFFRQLPDVKPEDFRIPLMCNAFSIFGRSAAGGHYFGRDFMFPTADVFQDTAAMIVYNPTAPSGRRVHPFVGLTAPGIVGSISAMNEWGVGVGLNMSPAANCNPRETGINSLLLVRLCAQYGDSAESAVDIIRNAPRGVSWNYVISDGTNDRACVVEAGSSEGFNDPTLFPPADVKPYLPDREFVGRRAADDIKYGMAVRWNGYRYPAGYLDYNSRLWDYFNRKNSTDKKIYDDSFSEKGFINRTGWEKNCPSAYYFAPQRETSDELVVATNHFIVPEMRYYAMHPWTAQITGDTVNDIQWRYDELNGRILRVLDKKGYVGWEDARSLISFLSPYGNLPSYYAGNPKSRDGREIRIEGCTSLFDLKNRIVESHYGYFCDKWVRATLPNYI